MKSIKWQDRIFIFLFVFGFAVPQIYHWAVQEDAWPYLRLSMYSKSPVRDQISWYRLYSKDTEGNLDLIYSRKWTYPYDPVRLSYTISRLHRNSLESATIPLLQSLSAYKEPQRNWSSIQLRLDHWKTDSDISGWSQEPWSSQLIHEIHIR